MPCTLTLTEHTQMRSNRRRPHLPYCNTLSRDHLTQTSTRYTLKRMTSRLTYPDLLGVIESVINTPLCRIRVSSHRFRLRITSQEHVYLYLSTVSRGPEPCIRIHECYSNHVQHRPSVCLVCTYVEHAQPGWPGRVNDSK